MKYYFKYHICRISKLSKIKNDDSQEKCMIARTDTLGKEEMRKAMEDKNSKRSASKLSGKGKIAKRNE